MPPKAFPGPYYPPPPNMPPSQPPDSQVNRPAQPAWTKEDDQKLLSARNAGQNWSEIARLHFPGKSSNACRKHYERLKLQQGQEDWDQQKMERLAREYMAVRKDMWQKLADRMGTEKWSTVEAKCMDQGLKKLQTLAKTTKRDSGVAGLGTGIGGPSLASPPPQTPTFMQMSQPVDEEPTGYPQPRTPRGGRHAPPGLQPSFQPQAYGYQLQTQAPTPSFDPRGQPMQPFAPMNSASGPGIGTGGSLGGLSGSRPMPNQGHRSTDRSPDRKRMRYGFDQDDGAPH